MKQDWLHSTLHLETYLCSPCLCIDENGLSIVTCYLHNYNHNKRYIHMATSPLGNLTHPHFDRLAPLATKIRGYVPSKRGEFTNGFTTSTSIGRECGISSLRLTDTRNFNVKSENLLPSIEPLTYQNRQDIRTVTNLLFNDSSINQDVIDYRMTSKAYYQVNCYIILLLQQII